MNLLTKVEIKEPDYKLNIKDKLFFIGSCFADNIGDKFYQNQFQALLNPYGVLYNPKSIANALNFIAENTGFNEQHLIKYNNKWHSLYHHGSYSSDDKNECLEKINKANKEAFNHILKTKYLFITFGTSWVYKLKDRDLIVANCHKIPQKYFLRYRLSVEEITQDYKKLISKLLQINSNIKIIFTVSPIRHLKDGAHGNQLSKSVLLLAIDSLVKSYKNVSYFPSYEIVLDELRDYRFYEPDMMHINKLATEYIWEQLSDTYFDKETKNLLPQINKLVKSVNHRPFDASSNEYKEFKQNLKKQIINFQEKYNINLLNLLQKL